MRLIYSLLQNKGHHMRLTRQNFTQEIHCCGDAESVPLLDVTIHDGGGGEYLVLTATAWALDSQADIDQLYHLLTGMLVSCREAEDIAHAS